MIKADRLEAEKAVLQNKLPSNIYMFREMGTSTAHLIVAARTNRGNIYTLKIMLNTFPEKVPEVFLTRRLKMKNGDDIPSYSHEMHTLNCGVNSTQICHYSESEWTPMVSLYKVYVKCRLWLEVYEQHLKSGKDINYYLANYKV